MKDLQTTELLLSKEELRNIDIQISNIVMGYTISQENDGTLSEASSEGLIRPLRAYSSDINAAWEVVEKLDMTVMPVDAGWFAFVGHRRPWASNAELLTFLQSAEFAHSGAAVGKNPSFTICLAALSSIEKDREF
jgi:hypothetical protein